MKIQPAVPGDLPKIKALTEACALAMQQKNIFQWNEHYPSLEKFKADLKEESLYILKDENKIMGIVVLSTFMDQEYIPIQWLTNSGNNLYIHRLATHPNVWGKGYGQQLMDFAEAYAVKQGHISVRLDTFSQNTRNHRFYEARGYQRLGDIFFPKQSEHPFHCYELVL